MRLDKAFRVILNSPIFSKMTVERATDRSVRFGAQDESQLRIFIIKVNAFILYFFINEIFSLLPMIVLIYVKNYNLVYKSSNDNKHHQISLHLYVLKNLLFINIVRFRYKLIQIFPILHLLKFSQLEFVNDLIHKVIRMHRTIQMIYQKNLSMNSINYHKKFFFFFCRVIEGHRYDHKDTSDEDSVESTKTGEQETIT